MRALGVVLVCCACGPVAVESVPNPEPGVVEDPPPQVAEPAPVGWPDYTPGELFPCADGSCVGKAVSLSAGDHFTCAVMADATVRCWGHDTFGQLGGSTRITSIPGLTGVKQVASGLVHSCARTSTKVFCWGANAQYQLGQAGLDPQVSATPLEVQGLPKETPVSLSAGVRSTCVTFESGRVFCWGEPDANRPGHPVRELAAADRDALMTVVAGGAMVARKNGDLVLYPEGGGRQVIGRFGDRQVLKLARGLMHPRPITLALLDDGSLRAFGAFAPGFRRCINPRTYVDLTPAEHGSLTTRTKCDLGALPNRPTMPLCSPGFPYPARQCSYRSCAGATVDCSALKDVPLFAADDKFAKVVDVSVNTAAIMNLANYGGGTAWGCVVSAQGRVRCFGPNHQGTLAEPAQGLISLDETSEYRWADLGFLHDIAQVAVNVDYACALDRAGAVWCWGRNDLDDGTPTLGSYDQATAAIPTHPVELQ